MNTNPAPALPPGTNLLARAYHIEQILAVLAYIEGRHEAALEHFTNAIELRIEVGRRYGRLDFGHWRMILNLKGARKKLREAVARGRPEEFMINEKLYNAVRGAVAVPDNMVMWDRRPALRAAGFDVTGIPAR